METRRHEPHREPSGREQPTSGAPLAPPSASAENPGIRLLLVSEQPALRENLARLLREAACDVVECASRPAGVQLLHRMEFHATIVGLSEKEAVMGLPNPQKQGLRLVAGAEPPELVGVSASLKAVRQAILQLAPTPMTLLVSGESGVGKAHVARCIHEASRRKGLSFVSLDCATVTEGALDGLLFGTPSGSGIRSKVGLLGLAEVGTVYLSGIEALSSTLQRKLLASIEEGAYLPHEDARTRAVTTRVVCGTTRFLGDEVTQGRFLYDFHSLLALYEFRIPPLRARPEDVPDLARSLIGRTCRRADRPVPDLDPAAEEILRTSFWPGNVRELGNVLERAIMGLRGNIIRPSDLPEGPYRTPPQPTTLREARADFEHRRIQETLARCGGDIRQAAEILGVDITTLYRKLGPQRL